jgi:hypothetical protein
VFLLLALLAIVLAAVEFHACGVMHSEMNQGLSDEMTP